MALIFLFLFSSFAALYHGRHCPDPDSVSDWMNFAFVLTAINLKASIGRMKRTPRFLFLISFIR